MARYERVDHHEITMTLCFTSAHFRGELCWLVMSIVCLPAMRKGKKVLDELLRVEGITSYRNRSQCVIHFVLVIIIGLILEQEGLNSYHHPLMDYGNIMYLHLYLSTLLSQFKHNLMIFVVPAALQDATSCLTAIKAHTGLGELRN